MAVATYPVTLKAGADYASATKVVDIKAFPDLGGAPEQLETTTMSDAAHTYIAGIKGQDALEFTANYDKDDLDSINEMDAETTFWLEFGTGGASGIFTWKGTIAAHVSGAGVNEVVEMIITISPSTPVTPYSGA